MNVLLSETTKQNINGSLYRSITGICENREVSVIIVTGNSSYVNVTVKNASHKVWKGMGKDFPTIEAAIANYKDSKIKAIIKSVKNLD